jgi:hypothetical protein
VLPPTLAVGPTVALHFSLSRLRVGEALPQKFSTILAGPRREETSMRRTCASLGGAARCGA